jgi:hypothetical protein
MALLVGATDALRTAASYASLGSNPCTPLRNASANATSELVPVIRSA